MPYMKTRPVYTAICMLVSLLIVNMAGIIHKYPITRNPCLSSSSTFYEFRAIKQALIVTYI
jgi:hypothetical protein